MCFTLPPRVVCVKSASENKKKKNQRGQKIKEKNAPTVPKTYIVGYKEKEKKKNKI